MATNKTNNKVSKESNKINNNKEKKQNYNKPANKQAKPNNKAKAPAKTQAKTSKPEAVKSNNQKSNSQKISNQKNSTQKNSSQKNVKKAPAKLKIIPLGGLHEIGKNMTVIEYGNDMIILDCGMSFPNSEMFGIDAVIPDFSYVMENAGKLRGLFITHAHEDHIGGIAYLLGQVNVPIYATKLTIGFIKNRLKEFKRENVKLNEIDAGDKIKAGCFKVEAIHTTHSVADSLAYCISTPIGNVVHTGDFKVDYTPVDGGAIDLGRMAELGKEGVLLLMADSTNAMRKGYTPSEANVGKSLGNIFAQISHRIIIATFSSNVHRVQKIIDLAVENNRKVAVSGRSMENMVAIAKELGYLNIPANTLVKLKDIKNIDDSKLVVITTGSQGEPMSALYRMASGEHKEVKIRKDDVVILSSSPVPGNEKDVSGIVNKLMEQGAQVIYNDIAETHVSGHACEEELKLIQVLLKPKFFMPVHGEARHLLTHAHIAENLGMKSKNIILAENGNVVEIGKDKVRICEESVPATDVLVDGLGVGDVGVAVLNERKVLSESGVVVLSATFDSATDELLAGPIIKTKGLIYVKEYGKMLEEAVLVVDDAVRDAYKQRKSRSAIEKIMVEALKKFIYNEIHRSPVIVPVFMEV